jgi:hypothetical protein
MSAGLGPDCVGTARGCRLARPSMASFLPANRRWLPAVAVAVVHLVICLVVVASPRTGHDEGQLMFGFSRALSLSFAANFFWQKIKPALALFYLPVVGLGFGAYLVAHVVVASAAVAGVGEVARSLGHRRPWLPSLVVALSPLFTWSSLVGVSNSDGVAFMVLFLYVLVVLDRPALAGVVLGLLPWVRFECATFSAALALYVLLDRRSGRFLAGLCAWPALYLGGGAVYHHDAIWFLHYLPNVSQLMPGNEVWAAEFSGHGIATLNATFSLVTPTLGLVVLLRPARLSRVELALGGYAALFLGLYVFTHLAPRDIGPAFALGFSSRYAVIALPSLALLVGRAIESLEDEPAPAVRDTIAAAALTALGWFARAYKADTVVLWSAAATGAIAASFRAGSPRLALASAIALASLGPLAAGGKAANEYKVRDGRLVRLTEWLEAEVARSPVEGLQIYTNSKMLPLYVERSGRLPGVRVRFLLAVDMSFEMTQLTNEANGQRAAVRATAPPAIFGDVVFPDDITPARVRPGTLFALTNDARTKLLLPPAIWEKHLHKIDTIDGVLMARFEP